MVVEEEGGKEGGRERRNVQSPKQPFLPISPPSGCVSQGKNTTATILAPALCASLCICNSSSAPLPHPAPCLLPAACVDAPGGKRMDVSVSVCLSVCVREQEDVCAARVASVRSTVSISASASNHTSLRRRNWCQDASVRAPRTTVAAYGSLWHTAQGATCTNQRPDVTFFCLYWLIISLSLSHTRLCAAHC